MNTSALHVFQVLRVISRAREPLGVSEVARRVGLSPSTAYRALVTLEEAQYLKRAPFSPKFSAGPMTQNLARSLFMHFKLGQDAREILQDLCDTVGDTVSLSMRAGWYSLRIQVLTPGSRLIFARHRLGETRPLHASIEGCAMLAELDEDGASRYRRFVRTHHQGLAAEIERGGFWKEMRLAKSAGIVARLNESDAIFHAAAGICLPDGVPIASVLASTPQAIARRGGEQTLGRAVKAAATKLQAMVAGRPELYISRFHGIDPDQIFFPGDSREDGA